MDPCKIFELLKTRSDGYECPGASRGSRLPFTNCVTFSRPASDSSRFVGG